MPDAVAEAERTVRQLGLKLTGVGVGATVVYWALVFQMPFFPLSWWALFLLGLVLYFFFPQTRDARRAREILRRWDEAEVRGLLESSGSTSDPRLKTAQNMVARITQHPDTDEATRRVAEDVFRHLVTTTRDQRLVEVAMQARTDSSLDDSSSRSLSDVLDHLEGRAAKLLGALAEMHGAVVGRDGAEAARVLRGAADVLAQLDAVNEVERLLELRSTDSSEPDESRT